MASAYILSFGIALAATILFSILTCFFIIQTFKLQAWFFFPMLIAMTSIPYNILLLTYLANLK